MDNVSFPPTPITRGSLLLFILTLNSCKVKENKFQVLEYQEYKNNVINFIYEYQGTNFRCDHALSRKRHTKLRRYYF